MTQHAMFPDLPAQATITEIVPLPSDPNMRRVRIGRKTIATLRANDLEQLNLKVGQRWTDALAKAVEKAVAANKARKAALTMLGRRAASHGEVIERLVRKGHELSIAQQIADEVAADGWIDDRAYAEAIVREAMRKKPASRRLLLAKLETKKIAPELAAAVADEAFARCGELEAALAFAREKLAAMRSLPASTMYRRLAGALARRGFNEDAIASVFDQLNLPPEETNDL